MPSPPAYSTAEAGRTLNLLDRVIGAVDQAARTVLTPNTSSRPYPAEGLPEAVLLDKDRKHVAALMRINHAGEVAAQALYQGQALVASREETRQALLDAGREETDHLAWCSRRIQELGGRTSVFSPVWYGGSFAIGMIAALASDRASLGFVAETERQVVDHLQSHLRQIPADDQRTKAIIEQMSEDEARHGQDALVAGGIVLPAPARRLMQSISKLMTRTAYWI
jgi:3-demethoxyubiquinol 3-hydroxylase